MPPRRSPCGACKSQRRGCLPDCVFAPFYPTADYAKFTSILTIYGFKQLEKFLQRLPPNQRQTAVDCINFDVHVKKLDELHGFTAFVTVLRDQLQEAHQRLAVYEGRQQEKPPSLLQGPDASKWEPLLCQIPRLFNMRQGQSSTSSPFQLTPPIQIHYDPLALTLSPPASQMIPPFHSPTLPQIPPLQSATSAQIIPPLHSPNLPPLQSATSAQMIPPPHSPTLPQIPPLQSATSAQIIPPLHSPNLPPLQSATSAQMIPPPHSPTLPPLQSATSSQNPPVVLISSSSSSDEEA